MTEYEQARLHVSRANMLDALYEAAKSVARLTDTEFHAVEHELRSCISVLQVRVIPPIAGSRRST